MIYQDNVKGRSSNIDSIRYCDNCKKLSIRFQSDPEKVYVYLNVSSNLYEDFIESPSLGQYYSRYIKGKIESEVLGITHSICFCGNNPEKKDNFCRSCGNKFDDEDNFCGHCGKKRS